LGNETINGLVQQQHSLVKALEFKTDKYTPQPSLKVAEVYDLEYHIQNSLRIVKDEPNRLLSEIHPVNESIS
jgi:hypothetical protein